MKTPTVDDKKPKRDNLGPTGPAKVTHDEGDNGKAKAGGADGSYEKEMETILERKKGQTPD